MLKINKNSYFFLVGIFLNLMLQAQEKEASTSYDYSTIAQHPRLLLNKGEEAKIIELINTNAELKKVHNYIITTAESLAILPPLVYQKNGNRLLHISRQALARLYFFSYRYRLTKDTKYLNRAEQELEAVCNFENWNPGHFLDVGEMTMAVSIAYDWLFDDLKETTKQQIRTAIVEKAFKPSYIEKYNWFLRRHSNWNSVCNAGLVYGALAIMEDEKEAAIPIIERALKSNLLPLQEYGPDGNYAEGPCYWNYGTTFQVMLIEALKSSLGSDNGLSKTKGFMESSTFMLFSAGSSGDYFNYYDCRANISAKTSLFWFAKEKNNPSLLYKEFQMIREGYYTEPTTYRASRTLPNAIIFSKDLNFADLKEPKETIFTGNGLTPVTIVRTNWNDDKTIYFGIKGGSSSDGHSHMDQGSFVYDIGTNRWAMDFGSQDYYSLESKGVKLWDMTQNSQRWDIFRYTNLNHNTLSINNQKHNIKGRANIIENYNSKAEKGSKIDLTEVLNFNNELKSAHRKGVVVNDSYLKIEDVIETNNKPVAVRWNMVTKSSAEIIDAKTIKITQKDKTLFLKFDADSPFTLAIKKSENPSAYKSEFGFMYGDYNAKNPGTVMIGFDATIPANTKANFTVTFLEPNQL
jgi:hypothetical protein